MDSEDLYIDRDGNAYFERRRHVKLPRLADPEDEPELKAHRRQSRRKSSRRKVRMMR